MRKSIIGELGIGSGMAIFVAVSLPTGGVSAPSLLAWAPALAGITALIMLSAFVALRARGIANVIWLAAATAVIYAFVNAVTKSGVDLLTSRGAGVLATWEPYALMAAGILSGLFGQSAFNAGPLSLSLPVIDTLGCGGLPLAIRLTHCGGSRDADGSPTGCQRPPPLSRF
jgi:hypothetical protein